MTRSCPLHPVAMLVLALAIAGTGAALCAEALAQAPKSRIVCWKDKSGKVIGCGDRVPDEYRNSATHELDKHGVTRSTTESADAAAKRRAEEAETAKAKAEEEKRVAEQQRQDAALISTYTSTREIDLRRDRDLQVIDLQLGQLKVSLKNATERQKEVRARADVAAKTKGGVSPALADELERAESAKQRAERNLAAKEKERQAIQDRYAAQKKRYGELRGEAASAKP